MFEFENIPGAKVAWGDESMRMHGTPPMYLMCATVFSEEALGNLQRLKSMKPRGTRKLHWYDMTDKEKARSLEILAETPQWSAVAIASPLYASIRPERGRRKCMERLLPAIEKTGVEALKLESRWKQEDKADLDMVFALHNRKIINNIRIEHVKPDTGEPRLWVPDQILGPIGDLLCGTGNVTAWGDAWNEVDRNVTIYSAALL